MVRDHANGVIRSRQPEHEFDEVSAGCEYTPGPEHAGSSNDQGVVQVRLRVEFSRQFGNRVSAQGMRYIRFYIGAALASIKDVICRIVNEASVTLATGHGNVTNSKRVDLVSGEGLFLGYIDLIVSGGIDDHSRIRFGNSLFDPGRIGNIQRLTVETLHSPSPAFEFGAQLMAELAASAEHNYFLPHPFAA